MLRLGERIDQRYEVLAKLGEGGMGCVYRVRHVHLGQTLALKVLTSQGAEAEAQFLEEARILAGLQHPHLPRVIDYFVEVDTRCLVMEDVPGEDLQDLLDCRGRPFEVAEVLPWLFQLLDALVYVHAQGVTHRDIKPANLKLRPDGKLVLVDFGIAKTGAQPPGRTSYAAKSAYTPYLAAPEQVAGHGTGPRTDLYAVGATFIYLLTNTLPPRAAALGDPLGLVFARAMALDPAGRWPDATAMREACARCRPGVQTARRDIRR